MAYSSDDQDRELGTLAGHVAMDLLIDDVMLLADEVQTELDGLITTFAREHLAEWKRLIAEVQSGEVDQVSRLIPGNAFRPTFHSRQAADHLEAERWTEAFGRYCMAGEFLIREVIIPKVKLATDLDMPAPTKHAWWRSDFLKVARGLGMNVEARSEFKEFERIYGLRNTDIQHGHREATMSEAVAAKRAFHGLQLLLTEMFAAEHGVSLDRLQNEALFTRTGLWTPEEVALIQHIVRELDSVGTRANRRFKSLLAEHDPAIPERLTLALDALTPRRRTVADHAFSEAMEDAFDLLKRIWMAATDVDSMLADAVTRLQTAT